jgi:hypothetical protein
MKGPGTLTIEAYVNGKLKSASIHINVICSPTGDSVFDAASVRHAMTQALTNSGINDSTKNRTEHGGFIYWDTTTHIMHVLDVPSSGQNICEYPHRPLVSMSGWFPVGHWHDHPFDPTKSELMPSGICPHSMNGGYPDRRPTYPDDHPNDGYPEFIWDGYQMYNSHPGSRGFDNYKRVDGSCHRY